MANEFAPVAPNIPMSPVDAPDFKPRPYVDRWTAAGASFAEAVKPIEAIGQLVSLLDVAETTDQFKLPRLSPQELKEKYKDSGYNFTIPMSEIEADHLLEFINEKKQYSDIVADGPQDGTQSVLNFTTAVGAQMTDPINLAISMASAGVVNAGLSGMASLGATSLSRVAMTPLARIVATAGLESAVTEPFSVVGEQLAGREYGVDDLLVNVTAGLLLGTVMDGAGHVLFRRNATLADLARVDKNTVAEVMASTISRAANDYMPDAQAIHRAVHDAFRIPDDVHLKSMGLPQYEYQPRFTDGNFSGSKVYAVTNNPGGDLTVGDTILQGKDFGDGVYLTDNPYYSNSVALRSQGRAAGSIYEVKVGRSTNLIDLDQPLPEPVTEIIEGMLKKHAPFFEPEQFNVPGKELLDGLKFLDQSEFSPNFKYEDVIQAVKDSGYDGFRYTDMVPGESLQKKQNVAMLFDDSILSKKSQLRADVRLKPEGSERTLKEVREKLFDPKQKYGYDEQAMKDFDEAAREFENLSDNFLFEDIQDLANEFNELQRQFPEDIEATLKKFQEQEKLDGVSESSLDNMILCTSKGFFRGR